MTTPTAYSDEFNPQPDKPGGVFTALDALEKEIGETDSNVDCLQTRLEPLLVESDEATPNVFPSSGGGSPLERRIHILVVRLAHVNEKQRIIIAQLDI